MSFLNWSNYLRRKSRTSRNSFNFSNRASGDTLDWGNGKSYKFDGKRWKKIQEQDDLEIQITDDPAEVSTSVLPSATAISTLKEDTEAAEAATASNISDLDTDKADKTMSNVDSIPSSKLTGALPALDGSALTGLSAVKIQSSTPSSPSLGDLWLNTTNTGHSFNIYTKKTDGVNTWGHLWTDAGSTSTQTSGGYNTGWYGTNYWSGSSTYSKSVGSITVPQSAMLETIHIKGSSGNYQGRHASAYIDWIKIGGQTIWSGNSGTTFSTTGDGSLVNVTDVAVPMGTHTVYVGVYKTHQSYLVLRLTSIKFTFSMDQ